jgi:hypothetical protein
MQTRHMFSALAIAALAILVGCGNDDGGGPQPVKGVDISPGKASLELGHQTEITAAVQGGESKNLTWYVNGVENGNTTFGTISQNSPVTYTAPDLLPYPATVTVKAVSTEDTTKFDTCDINLKFTKIFVDAVSGNDDTGTGCINSPLKSITYGLDLAQRGMTVLVQPGVYDQANGEVFQIAVMESISLVGMDWETCIIRGHQPLGYEQTIWMTGDHPVFRKFTVQMGEPADTAWSVAMYLQAIDGLVDSIRVSDRANYSICRFTGSTNMVVQNCYFVIDGEPMGFRAFEFTNDNYGAAIRNTTMSGFSQAMNIGGHTDVLIEDCSIVDNERGVRACCYNDPQNDANPDLGYGARGSAGGNVFSGYTDFALVNGTSNTIYAKGNTWDHAVPIEGVDYSNDYDGEVITQ